MKNNTRLQILFQDDDFIAIHKPSNVVSIKERGPVTADTVQEKLAKEQRLETLIIHRLDRETTGVMLLAKHKDAQRKGSELFAKRKVEKKYLALLRGITDSDEFTVNKSIKESHIDFTMMISDMGKEAISIFKVIERFRSYTLTEVEILTGRTHQIRVHSAYMGHPLAIDSVYGNETELLLSKIKRKYNFGKWKEERPIMSRLSLHASVLSFQHPFGDEKITIECPLPKDFRVLLSQLRKYDAT